MFFFSDFINNESIEHTQYLNKGQEKIFEIITYWESIYECHLPKSENIKNDVIHLLKVITAVTEFLGMKNQLTSPLDIVHVFAKANNNNIKEKKLSFLPIYNQNYNKTLRQFEDILRLLDKLIVKELVKVRVDLKKANTSTSSTQLTCKVNNRRNY
ncbi:unnamed protein product [Rhizophagus irregularis]|uniref:Uncharacterized protein n=1 Tax=Rhizophagus irregularis TaxID=588596 RepID=A0A915Z0W7_9GLOM|nr:unnamed protein product [Rhizophagus irregularis]